MKKYKIIANFVIDTNFWAILPAININLHCPALEIEWLCLGIYVDFIDPNKNILDDDCRTYFEDLC
jgi:hypothetical protein